MSEHGKEGLYILIAIAVYVGGCLLFGAPDPMATGMAIGITTR